MIVLKIKEMINLSYLKRAYSKVIKISLVRRRYWIVIAYPPKLLCGQTAYSSENLTLAAKEDIPQVINTLNCL